MGTSWTDNDAKLLSHVKQIRGSRIGLEDANSGRRAIRNNRAQIGGLATKPARLQWTELRTRRFEEDSFRRSFSNDSVPSTMLDVRWGQRRTQKIRWRTRPLQPVEMRSSAGACTLLRSASSRDHRGQSGPFETHMMARRAYVLAAEEDQNDACEDEMNALIEFLTTEPAICPTA